MRGKPEVMDENWNPEISVIVTVHNAEKYLEECLQSVINQTFSNIEILCIDGGSKDASPEILNKYAIGDKRIRIVNDENTSYGHKINRGIEEAEGKYIAVLESDDMYELYMLEHLYEIAERYQVDFVNGDYTCFYTVNKVRFCYVTKMYAEDQYGSVKYNKEYPEEMGVIPRFWTGIFRKDFLKREKIRMNESPGASFQDMSFRFLTSALAESCYHVDEPVYLYRIDNPGSSMHDCKKTTVIADEHAFLKLELNKRCIDNPYIWHNAYDWKYRDFFGNMSNLPEKYRQELFERYLNELSEDRERIIKYRLGGYSDFAEKLIFLSPEEVMKSVDAYSVKKEVQEKALGKQLEFLTSQESIVIFGCGIKGKALLTLLNGMRERIIAFSDNNSALWGKSVEGIRIFPPEVLAQKYRESCVVIANRQNADEIYHQLRDMNISNLYII